MRWMNTEAIGHNDAENTECQIWASIRPQLLQRSAQSLGWFTWSWSQAENENEQSACSSLVRGRASRRSFGHESASPRQNRFSPGISCPTIFFQGALSNGMKGFYPAVISSLFFSYLLCFLHWQCDDLYLNRCQPNTQIVDCLMFYRSTVGSWLSREVFLYF